MCCEVCEHTQVWPQILETACLALRPGGRVILTTAGPGRPEHSGHDGMHLRDGEWYANIDPGALYDALKLAGFQLITIDVLGYDVRATAIKPEE